MEGLQVFLHSGEFAFQRDFAFCFSGWGDFCDNCLPTGRLLITFQYFSRTLDRIALAVQQVLNFAHQFYIFFAIPAPATTALHRIKVFEFLLPIAQCMGR